MIGARGKSMRVACVEVESVEGGGGKKRATPKTMETASPCESHESLHFVRQARRPKPPSVRACAPAHAASKSPYILKRFSPQVFFAISPQLFFAARVAGRAVSQFTRHLLYWAQFRRAADS